MPPSKAAAPAAARRLRPSPLPPVVAVAAPPAAPARPEPRKIVPQPRPAPRSFRLAAPAIASRPPAGPVVAKAPAGAAAARPVVAVVPPQDVVVKPPTASALGATQPKPAAPNSTCSCEAHGGAPKAAARRLRLRLRLPAPEKPEVCCTGCSTGSRLPQAPVAPVNGSCTGAGCRPCCSRYRAHQQHEAPEPRACTCAAPAPRRVVMPQTGPRPVYKAPIGGRCSRRSAVSLQAEEFSVASRSLIAGRQRSGQLSAAARAASSASGGAHHRASSRAARAPSIQHAHRLCRSRRTRCSRRTSRLWCTSRIWRSAPGGFGEHARAAALRPPAKHRDRSAPRSNRGRRGGQQYPKTKEGPMKGFVPPPRFGGAANSAMSRCPSPARSR